MGGRSVRKYNLDGEDVYGTFDSTIDEMVSPLFKNPEALARFLDEKGETFFADMRGSFDEWLENAQLGETQYSLDEEKVGLVLEIVKKLKNGSPITDEEAKILYSFVDFIDAYVAPHQNEYPELSDEQLNRVIDALQMRDDYPEGWEAFDILDQSEFRTFQARVNRLKYSSLPKEPEPSVNEIKLTGLYLEALFAIAGRMVDEIRKKLGGEVRARFLDLLHKQKA